MQRELKRKRDERIKSDFAELKKAGFTTRKILEELSNEFVLSPRTIRNKLQPLKHI